MVAPGNTVILHRPALVLALLALLPLIPTSALARPDPCILRGDCIDLPDESLLITDAGDTSEPMPATGAGLLVLPSSGNCPFGGDDRVTDRGTITPYGSAGWSDRNGNRIDHFIRVCESRTPDSAGYRYVFWIVYQSFSPGGSWHARYEHLDAAWFEAAANEADVVDVDPKNTASSGCGGTRTYGLSASANGFGAELSWEEEMCDISVHKDAWTTTLVRWYGRVHGTDGPDAPTFTYALVTRVPAGAVASIDVQHTERFCRDWSSCYSQSRFVGAYTAGFRTTPLVEPEHG